MCKPVLGITPLGKDPLGLWNGKDDGLLEISSELFDKLIWFCL